MKQRYGEAYLPFGGDRYLMANCPGDELDIPPVADDWLISPEINGLSYITFQARPVSDLYGDETLDVMYSTTTADRESFQLLERMKVSVSLTETPSGTMIAYKRMTSELPADARYFALRYASHDVFGIMLDDLEYAPASADKGINGYNIYRDGNLIAENAPAGGSFTDTDVTDGTPHTYTVFPLTSGDNGAMSNQAHINGGSAIEAAGISEPVSVKAIDGYIRIETDKETAIKVIGATGAVVATASVNGTTDIPAAAGIYIVTTPASVHKVAVR